MSFGSPTATEVANEDEAARCLAHSRDELRAAWNFVESRANRADCSARDLAMAAEYERLTAAETAAIARMAAAAIADAAAFAARRAARTPAQIAKEAARQAAKAKQRGR